MSDIDKIKEKSIVEYLSAKGIEYKNKSGGKLFYHSPFRTTDDTPSFVVYENTNSYYDWGESSGGNIISLVMKLERCNFKEAINILQNNIFVSSSDICYSPRKKTAEDSYYQIRDIKPITNQWLLDYACGKEKVFKDGVFQYDQRGIDIDILRLYCQEIHFVSKKQIEEYGENAKTRIAIGFVNVDGGYEFRSPVIKRGTTPKNVSVIQGSYPEYDVFEGFFDFLTHLTYNKISHNHNFTIVLNSLAMNVYAPKDMDWNIYLDHDASANNLINKLTIPYSDKRDIYRGYKDYNQWYQRCILKIPE